MKVSKVEYYYEQEFEKYLQAPGVSFSSLKNKTITETPAMALGTSVHNYLLEPKKYNYENHEIVSSIAASIRKIIDPSLFECEVSVTANFEHNGFVLPYKGRIDMLQSKRLVIDLKVLTGSLQNAIDFFKYDRQVSGYCYATGIDKAVIIAYNKIARKVELKSITPCAKFWEQIIIERGKLKHL